MISTINPKLQQQWTTTLIQQILAKTPIISLKTTIIQINHKYSIKVVNRLLLIHNWWINKRSGAIGWRIVLTGIRIRLTIWLNIQTPLINWYLTPPSHLLIKNNNLKLIAKTQVILSILSKTQPHYSPVNTI